MVLSVDEGQNCRVRNTPALNTKTSPMATLQLYDQLLQFPLFLGMSREDFSRIAGNTRFDFRKEGAHVVLFHEGDVCDHLCFLLSGTVTVSTLSDDGSYTLTEELSAPVMLQPEALFGYHQRYTHTFRSTTPVALLHLARPEVVRMSEEFLIFRINLLNLLATKTQKMMHQPWRRYPQSLDERIVRFIASRCVHPAGHKTLRILMTQLAAEVGDSRLDVSRALNRLQDAGLLTLHRGRVEIPQMERLLM